MSNQTISVVIPTRNRAPYLKRTLDALLQDNYPYKEIIVVDGASTDGTLEVLESYGDLIRWISEPDKGEYDARNKGLLMATGELFRYLNDDDVPIPGAFAYAAQYFESHPDVDILFGQGDLYYARYGIEPILLRTPVCTNESITAKNFIRRSKPVPFSETAFFRRRVIERIGLFRLDYPGADGEYWLRSIKAGLRIEIVDEKFIRYYATDFHAMARKEKLMLLQEWQIAREYGDVFDVLYVTLAKILPGLAYIILRGPVHRLGIYPTKILAKRHLRKLKTKNFEG